MHARGAPTAGAVRAALDGGRPEAGELYAIEKHALDAADSSELQRMREALAEPNLGPGEYKRKLRRLQTQGADEAAAEARGAFFGKLKADDPAPWWDGLPPDQRLVGFSLELQLSDRAAERYYDAAEQSASEAAFATIERAIDSFLGSVGLAQHAELRSVYLSAEAARAVLEAKIDALDARSQSATEDAAVDKTEAEIKKIKDEIKRDKKELDANIKRLDGAFRAKLDENARTDTLSVYKYVFGDAFARRRREASSESKKAMTALDTIRQASLERHARGGTRFPGYSIKRGESIRRVAGKLNELKEMLNFVRSVKADTLAAIARAKHEAEFARGVRRTFKAGGTRAVRDKKILKEIEADIKKEEAELAKWVAWKRNDPRGKQGDMIRRGKINPPPEYWLLLKSPLVGDFFAQTFYVYAIVLNNLALINFKTEMRPWTWEDLIGFVKRSYVQFYMTSTRFKIDAAQKALAEGGDLRFTNAPAAPRGSTRPPPMASRSTLPVSVRGDLLLAQNTGFYNQNIERYRAVLDSDINEFYRVGATRIMTQMDKEYIGDLEWKVRLLDVLFLGKGKPPKQGNLYHSEMQVGNSEWAEFMERIFGNKGILQEKPDFEDATTYWNDRMADDELALIRGALNSTDPDAALRALGLSMQEKQGMRDKDTPATTSKLVLIRREAAQRLLDLVVPRYGHGPREESKEEQERDKALDEDGSDGQEMDVDAGSDGEGMGVGDRKEDGGPDAMQVEEAGAAEEAGHGSGDPGRAFNVQIEQAPRGDGPPRPLDTHGQAKETWVFARKNDDPRHPDYRQGTWVVRRRNPMRPWETVRTTPAARHAPYTSRAEARRRAIQRWGTPGAMRRREAPPEFVYKKPEHNDGRFQKLVGDVNSAEKELDVFVGRYGWFAGEDNRRRRQLNDKVKFTAELLAKFLDRNPSYRAKLSDALRRKHGALNRAPVSARAAREKSESVTRLADSIAAKETELTALKAVLERLGAGERVPMRSKAAESDALDVLTDADGEKYRLVKRRDPDTGAVEKEEREYLPADERSKAYFYDKLGVQKAISELESELGVLQRQKAALQTEGATLPLAMPFAMRRRGRGMVGGDVFQWNRPRPEWLSSRWEPEEAAARERDRMTPEKMNANLAELLQTRIDKANEEDARLKAMEVEALDAMSDGAQKDAAVEEYARAQRVRRNRIELLGARKKTPEELARDIERDFDEKIGSSALLPDGVNIDDCLIKTMLRKKEGEARYIIKGNTFMGFFANIIEAFPQTGIGAAAIEITVETLVSESLERSRTATVIEPEQAIKGTREHQSAQANWAEEYARVLGNMGLREEDLVYTDAAGKETHALTYVLQKRKLEKNLARRLWRQSLTDENGVFDEGRAKRASWDAKDRLGRTFGLTSIFSADAGFGKQLPELLDFLCELGMVRDDPQSDENIFEPKTQLGEYHQRVGAEHRFARYEPEALFRAIWIRRQMLGDSEWEEELQARNAREGEVRGVARAQAEQAGQAYYDAHFDEAERDKKVALAKRAIARRAAMIPYESNAAEEAAKEAAAQKAIHDYERNLRNEGRAKFKEDRNVLKYAKELWLKRVFAKKKGAMDRSHARGFLDLTTGASSAGAAYEPVGYDILARALAQIDGLKSPGVFANLVKTAVHELVKERAEKQAPVPPTAPDPRQAPPAVLERYQNEMAAYLAQYYEAKQMASKNVFAYDSWVDNASALPALDLKAGGQAALGGWVKGTMQKIARDLMGSAYTKEIAPELVKAPVVSALMASQNDVYRMHYEMDSIEDRRAQALRQQKRVIGSLPAYALIPDMPMSVAKKLFEIASGAIEPQLKTSEVARDPRTGEPVIRTTYRKPAKTKARDAAKRAYEAALDEYNKASDTLNGAEREVAGKTVPTDLDREKIEAATADVAERKAEAAALRSAYKLAQAEYEVETDAMIEALFEQEERLRKDGEYKKRKAVYEYGKEKLLEEYGETLPEQAGAGEGDPERLEKRRQQMRKGIVAKQKNLERNNPDAAEDKKRECREQIAYILAGNVRRKWWNAWLERNPDADVEPFKMLLLDRGCYEYVQDLIGGFGSYFEEGALVLKDGESTRELRELATETKQREAYVAWEADQTAGALQQRIFQEEERLALSPEELMYLKGFKIDDVDVASSSSGEMEIDADELAMEIEAHRRGLKRRQEAIEQQRDSLEPESSERFIDPVRSSTRQTLTEILDGVKKLKQDADVSAAVLDEWLHPRATALRGWTEGQGVYRIGEQVQEVEREMYEKWGELMFSGHTAEVLRLRLEIAELQSRKREYEQLEEWARPRELQANTLYQAKDSLVNAVAELKRQIYYVQAMRDGHADRYTEPGLATYEQIVAAEDPAPGEPFRLDQMAREAYRAQLAELATAKRELAAAEATLAAVRLEGASAPTVQVAQERVAEAKKKVERKNKYKAMRPGPAMPAMQEGVREAEAELKKATSALSVIRSAAAAGPAAVAAAEARVRDAEARLAEERVQFKPMTLLDQTKRRWNALKASRNAMVNELDDAGARSEEVAKLDAKLAEEATLQQTIENILDHRLEVLRQQLEIVGALYEESKPNESVQPIAGVRASKAINPELLPYARLNFGPQIDGAEPAADSNTVNPLWFD